MWTKSVSSLAIARKGGKLKKEEHSLRVGILGCGPISQFAHLESAQKARNVVLRAVCDADESLAQRFGTFYDAKKIYLNYDEMLADDSLDAVIIATSDAFHVPAARKALAQGKHVLCEKPLGVSVEEVRSLAEDVHKSGLLLQVGHMLRFDPGIEATRKFIDEEMGQMLALKAWYCDSTHRYDMTDAVQPLPRFGAKALKPKGDPKANRAQYYMLAHGCHLADLARYLGGPITAVRARLSERFGAYCWFVETEFANGTLGHLDLTVAVRMDWFEGFHIYGENGSAVGKIFNPWYYKSSEVDIFQEKDATTHRVLGADGHFYRRQLEAFADAILKGTPMRGANVEDGLASVQAMVAIARSAESGQRVELASAGGAV
jgi:predicted dehydrogenase